MTFACEGVQLVGTVDHAGGLTGVLLVSGGNEVRSGAWNGQALLAARLAARGVPVMRFDRRGVGDSEGENRGFRDEAEDIRAALAAFRSAVPGMGRVFGFGNCDAASALMLGGGCGLDGLVLSNPWTFDEDGGEDDEAPAPPAALRAHYAKRLRDPAALMRLLRGRISLKGLLGSLRAMAAPTLPTTLAGEMTAGLAGFAGPVRILVAERDRTGQAFLGLWPRDDRRVVRCAGASHSYAEESAQEWLLDQIFSAFS